MSNFNKTKYLTYITMLSALSIVINLFESWFIPPIQFGIRFGLANIIALITVKLFGVKELLIVNIMRILIGSLLRGVIFGSPFLISFGGILLSTISIIIFNKLKTSLIFMSIMSAIFHSLGQVLIVSFIYHQSNVMMIMPILLISSVLTGCLTGFVAKECMKRLRK